MSSQYSSSKINFILRYALNPSNQSKCKTLKYIFTKNNYIRPQTITTFIQLSLRFLLYCIHNVYRKHVSNTNILIHISSFTFHKIKKHISSTFYHFSIISYNIRILLKQSYCHQLFIIFSTIFPPIDYGLPHLGIS